MRRWIVLAVVATAAGLVGRHLVFLVLPLWDTPVGHESVWMISSVFTWLALGRFVRGASAARTVTVGAFSALGGAVVVWLLALAFQSIRAPIPPAWSFHALYLVPLMGFGITFPVSCPLGIGMAFAARRILRPLES